SPTLCPEEILIDHPERMRAVIVEGSNPLLSYSDTSRWREACAQLELLVVIEPAMTETAQLAHYVLPTPVGYEKWEIANFPKGFPQVLVQVRPPVVPGPEEALPEPEIYVRLSEAMDLFGKPPSELFDLAAHALEPDGAAAFLATAQQRAVEAGKSADATNALLFWAYRTVGTHLPAPSLAAVWLLSGLNAMLRPESVFRTLGDEWRDKSPFEVGAEIFRRILAHPEGVEIARATVPGNLEANINFPDKRVHLAPESMLEEIRRAIKNGPAHDPAYPFILGAGLRTRWTANTIHRDPAWRKGQGPHCALHLTPADAQRLGVRNGDAVRVSTRRGALTLPAQVDPKLLDGYVWMPNGFGHMHDGSTGELNPVGGNHNELTDIADRDPFTGVPHHRYVQCRIDREAS
ncbi:MAG TPA: molybdopterin dinucleotide binding domain-containing protein, partial [Candidatus Acidoferrales bacterium]|nr:molybdopterin dinucleotide binding domain-containing protein [Candidatus Acidoferrales bacterium]